MNRWRIWALGLALAVCAGCQQESANPGRLGTDPNEPTAAQAKLATLKLWLGSEEMTAEVAMSAPQMRTGMMFRTNRLGETEGMIFPLPVTQRASFWMKNCPLPLGAAYIDPEGVIQEIHAFKPNDTNAVTAAAPNIRFVLETADGWFERHHIGVGTSVRTEHGPLMETFFGRR